MPRSDLDRLISSASSVDILLYIDRNPGCRKSDIYHNVTRNVHTLEKLIEFKEVGLLEMDEGDRRTTISLTDRGRRMAEALGEMERILGEDDPPSEHPVKPSERPSD